MIKTILRSAYGEDTRAFDREVNDAVNNGWKIKSITAVPKAQSVNNIALFAVLEKPNISNDD